MKLKWLAVMLFTCPLFAGDTTYTMQQILNRAYRDNNGGSLSVSTSKTAQGVLNSVFSADSESLMISSTVAGSMVVTGDVYASTITLNMARVDNVPVVKIKTSGSPVMGIGADGASTNYGLAFFSGSTKMGVWETNSGLIIGDGYATSNAPAAGLIVEGNVGISTNTPTNTLHIKGSIRIQDAGSGNSAYFNNTGGYTKISDINDDRVWINNSNGYFGIGIAPSYRLHVVGAVGADAAVFTDNTNSGVHVGAGTSGGHVRSDSNTNLILGSGVVDNFVLSATSTTCNTLLVCNSGAVFTNATTAQLVALIPKAVGEHWWNTDTNELWIATGTAAVNQFVHK